LIDLLKKKRFAEQRINKEIKRNHVNRIPGSRLITTEAIVISNTCETVNAQRNSKNRYLMSYIHLYSSDIMNCMEIIQLYARHYLCFELPSVLLKNRTEKFRKKYIEYHTRYGKHIDKLCKLV